MNLLGCQKGMRHTHSGCRIRIEKRAGVGFSGGQEGGGKPTMIPIKIISFVTADCRQYDTTFRQKYYIRTYC